MKKIIKIENNHDPKKIRVEWAIGNTCNYSCNYCFPGSHEGDIPWPAGENVELFVPETFEKKVPLKFNPKYHVCIPYFIGI